MSRRGAQKKAQRQRSDAWYKVQAETLMRISAAGGNVDVLDAGIFHHRVSMPNGRVIDFWGSTGTWIERGGDRGKGLESMLDAMAAELVPAIPAASTARRHVAMFCDASFKEGVGGYGVWMKTEGMPSGMQFGGPIAGSCIDSTDSELRSIGMGLLKGVEANIIRPGDEVWVQCDNVGALAALMLECGAKQSTHKDSVEIPQPRRLVSSLKGSMVLAWIKDTQRQNDLAFVVRHVRGHKKGQGRQWVNRLVDGLAKRGRHQAEQQRKETPCANS